MLELTAYFCEEGGPGHGNLFFLDPELDLLATGGGRGAVVHQQGGVTALRDAKFTRPSRRFDAPFKKRSLSWGAQGRILPAGMRGLGPPGYDVLGSGTMHPPHLAQGYRSVPWCLRARASAPGCRRRMTRCQIAALWSWGRTHAARPESPG